MKKEIFKELEELNSSLVKIEKANIKNAPEEYFEKMQQSVFNKLDANNKPRKLRNLWIGYSLMGVAASLLLILSIYFLMGENDIPTMKTEFATSDIINYLSEDMEYIDEYTLMEYIDEEDFGNIQEIDIDDESIKDYLKENSEFNDDIEIYF